MHEHHGPDLDWILGGDRVHNAIVMIDGFDYYSSTENLAKGWTSGSPNVRPAGRFGGQAARQGSGSALTARNFNGANTYSTLILGFALRVATIPGAGNNYFVVRGGATTVVQFDFDASKRLRFRNSGGTVIATGTTILAANVWYYIEVKMFVNVGTPASGTIEVHLNGVSGEIASTAANLGSTLMDNLLVADSSNFGNALDFDDMYAADTTGSAPRNTFLGDVRVQTIAPNGAGAHTQWTPSGGGSNYVKVQDATAPDGDTTYNADATVGHYDTYACSDIDGGATVFGVQTNLYARKDDAAARQIAPVVRQSATDYDGTTITLGASYNYFSQIYQQDPTSADWTATVVNADEFGIKLVA